MLQTGNKLKYYIGIDFFHLFEEGIDPKDYQQKFIHYMSFSTVRMLVKMALFKVIVFNNVLTGEEKAVVLTNSWGCRLQLRKGGHQGGHQGGTTHWVTGAVSLDSLDTGMYRNVLTAADHCFTVEAGC